MDTTHDLIVVGAGPAGSAAAVGHLRANPDARVLILDRAAAGRDKTCGDALGPDSVREIIDLGLLGIVRAPERVEKFRITSPGGASISGRPPVAGYVIPRAELDERLLGAAIAAGAEFVQHRVRELTQHPDRIELEHWSAPYLIAADGANSTVRKKLGIRSSSGKNMAVAIRGYAPKPAGFDELYIRWDQQRGGGLCYVWAFPTAHDTVNVGYGLSLSANTGGRAQLVERMSALLAEFDLRNVRLSGHRLPLSSDRPRLAHDRVLLTGDAANLINPLSGEGIFYALASGALAGRASAEAAESGGPGPGAGAGVGAGARYEDAMRIRFGRHHRQMRLAYPLMDAPGFLEALVRAGGRDPRVIPGLLDLAVGERGLGVGDALRIVRAARAR